MSWVANGWVKLVAGNMVWGCRLIGKVGSRWSASRQAGGFRDAELGFELVQSVGGATRRGRLDEGKRLGSLYSTHRTVGKPKPHGGSKSACTTTERRSK